MTTPMDGVRNLPLTDSALTDEQREDTDRPDGGSGDASAVDATADPLGGADGPRGDDRTAADRDEAERYGQDDDAGAPLDAQDEPDVISLDEQGQADRGGDARDRGDSSAAGAHDARAAGTDDDLH